MSGINFARKAMLFNLFLQMRRYIFIVSIAHIGFFGQEGRAESLSLGPFKLKVFVYGVALEPWVDIVADIATTHAAAHIAADVRVSAGTWEFNNEIVAIAARVLPIKVQAGSCELDITALSKPSLKVSDNIAFVQATVSVTATQCPLKGDVSIAARFTPSAASAGITMKILSLDIQVPLLWRLAGSVSGKSPSALIEAAIRKRVETWVLPFPTIGHVQGTFQGVSLSESGDAITVSVRSDALIERQAILDALNGADWFKKLEIKVP